MGEIKFRHGFTLVELLVVISVIGLLSTLGLIALDSSRKKARDAKRLADIRQVQKALESYYSQNNCYPTSDNDGCGSWDIGNQDFPLLNNKLPGIMDKPPRDPTALGNCSGYRYYRYGAGSYGCDTSKGNYYVLGVTDLETSGNPHPDSPGFNCPGRNWQPEFDWVTGEFER